MGQEIKQGFDSTIDDALNITGQATGWASRMSEVAEGLKSSNNELGSAAKLNAVSTATGGSVPLLNVDGKIETAQLPTATIGGIVSSGLIPLLNASGQLPASMVTGGSGGGIRGIRGIWVYTNTDMAGNAGQYDSLSRRWRYTWRPRDRFNSETNTTTILIIATGGGGSGAHGPSASVSNGAPGGGSVAGYDARKGGGGGAGATVIAWRGGIDNNTTAIVDVGEGGSAMAHTGAIAANNGNPSKFGTDITATGGGYGNPLGDGGRSNTTSGIGNQYLGFQIPGGSGGDGTFDRMGAGSGGASFWGGGFSPGNGRGDNATSHSAPGGGGGGAHGSIGQSPYTFTADRPGFAGSNGIVVIIGF